MTRTGTCAECGDEAVADGTQAGVMGGRLICADCTDVRVAFVAECLDCDWDHPVDDRTTNRHHARTRAQQEGNTHESEMRFAEDESHETVWREVDPATVANGEVP